MTTPIKVDYQIREIGYMTWAGLAISDGLAVATAVSSTENNVKSMLWRKVRKHFGTTNVTMPPREETRRQYFRTMP